MSEKRFTLPKKCDIIICELYTRRTFMGEFSELTKHLINVYYGVEEQDSMSVLDMFDDDVVVIGTGRHEFYKNLGEFSAALGNELEERGSIKLQLENMWCEEQKISVGAVIAYGGVYIHWEKEDKTASINMETRFSVLYKEEEGRWRIIHLHQSVPNYEQINEEAYPKILDRQIERAYKKISVLEKLAEHDGLTGLLNYRAFLEKCSGADIALQWLFLIDIDNFKLVNDTLGHLQGNKALRLLSSILTESVGENDLVCRMGGDEFILLCRGVGSRGEAQKIAEKILGEAAKADKKLLPGVSIGIKQIGRGELLESAVKGADKALYISKAEGKNKFTFSDK